MAESGTAVPCGNPFSLSDVKPVEQVADARYTLLKRKSRRWCEARGRQVLPPPLKEQVETLIAEWFQLVDSNKSGYLNNAVLAAALKAAELPYVDDSIKEMLDIMDFNGDGRIDWQEFHTFISYAAQDGQDLIKGVLVLPSGKSLPLSAMIKTIRRKAVLNQVQQGGRNIQAGVQRALQYVSTVTSIKQEDLKGPQDFSLPYIAGLKAMGRPLPAGVKSKDRDGSNSDEDAARSPGGGAQSMAELVAKQRSMRRQRSSARSINFKLDDDEEGSDWRLGTPEQDDAQSDSLSTPGSCRPPSLHLPGDQEGRQDSDTCTPGSGRQAGAGAVPSGGPSPAAEGGAGRASCPQLLSSLVEPVSEQELCELDDKLSRVRLRSRRKNASFCVQLLAGGHGDGAHSSDSAGAMAAASSSPAAASSVSASAFANASVAKPWDADAAEFLSGTFSLTPGSRSHSLAQTQPPPHAASNSATHASAAMPMGAVSTSAASGEPGPSGRVPHLPGLTPSKSGPGVPALSPGMIASLRQQLLTGGEDLRLSSLACMSSLSAQSSPMRQPVAGRRSSVGPCATTPAAVTIHGSHEAPSPSSVAASAVQRSATSVTCIPSAGLSTAARSLFAADSSIGASGGAPGLAGHGPSNGVVRPRRVRNLGALLGAQHVKNAQCASKAR